MAKGRLVGLPGDRSAQVHQYQLHRTSDGGVGSPALAETIVAGVDVQFLGQRTIDDQQGAMNSGGTLDTAQVEAMVEYGDSVRRDITSFLNSGNNEAFDRVVPAHYGGEVTVVELLNIILSHSTHHLKQVYWFMETELGVQPEQPASADDMEGIVTPEALI